MWNKKLIQNLGVALKLNETKYSLHLRIGAKNQEGKRIMLQLPVMQDFKIQK